jgi:hypothetical protein
MKTSIAAAVLVMLMANQLNAVKADNPPQQTLHFRKRSRPPLRLRASSQTHRNPGRPSIVFIPPRQTLNADIPPRQPLKAETPPARGYPPPSLSALLQTLGEQEGVFQADLEPTPRERGHSGEEVPPNDPVEAMLWRMKKTPAASPHGDGSGEASGPPHPSSAPTPKPRLSPSFSAMRADASATPANRQRTKDENFILRRMVDQGH